ncbi:MAG TPA: hypothetical protein VJN18_01870 [Polyangiaceae bacterium]|nr:hypothetical protein [Polyangiaceae bacterium]
MTDSPIRLSPSGPIIGKGTSPGPGARIRLTEALSVMGGTQGIPTIPDVISPDGFGVGNPLVLTLDAPKAALRYRAHLSLDVINLSTNEGGEVVLYLDVSVDGGTSYTNCAKNMHIINSTFANIEGRQMQLWLPLTLGSVLGVNDAPPAASIKLRARANQTVGSPSLAVSSSSTTNGSSPVTELNGTIHMELEECL